MELLVMQLHKLSVSWHAVGLCVDSSKESKTSEKRCATLCTIQTS